MRRIERAYCNRFVAHLGRLKARRLDKAVVWFQNAVRELAQKEKIPTWEAARNVWERVWMKTCNRMVHNHPKPMTDSVRFRCDSGLGKLARWLRAAGYEADWQEGWDDSELVRRCLEDGSILITTDSLLMERTLLRTGAVRALWIPPAHGVREQLKTVLRELSLPLRQPRCMNCGGLLHKKDKAEVAGRIPPRTFRWIDDYYQCERCGKLLWEGTHWSRIRAVLSDLAANES